MHSVVYIYTTVLSTFIVWQYTEIQTNGMELSSDPLADQILEIVNGATKYKVRKFFFFFFSSTFYNLFYL
jgi:hypothetical protein